ncbi:MAG: hypothetical protein EA352_11705, partial [Gemmatimonadales bacterium]
MPSLFPEHEMEIIPLAGESGWAEWPLLAVLVPRGDGELKGALARLDRMAGGALSRARASGDFAGRDEDVLVVRPEGDGTPARLVFVGLGTVDGSRPVHDGDRIRNAAGRAVRQAESLRVDRIGLVVPAQVREAADLTDEGAAQMAAEGLALAAFDFRELRSPDAEEDRDEGDDQ